MLIPVRIFLSGLLLFLIKQVIILYEGLLSYGCTIKTFINLKFRTGVYL